LEELIGCQYGAYDFELVADSDDLIAIDEDLPKITKPKRKTLKGKP
jgi:hypothetical protein